MRVFPEDYPFDLREKIIEDGGAENAFDCVYRVARSGIINRDAFLSSFQERKLGLVQHRDGFLMSQQANYDIGAYSTSCFEKKNRANKILQVIKKHSDGPVLLAGKIVPDSGLSMRTADSKSKRKAGESHIDWWIYSDFDPSGDFSLESENNVYSSSLF